jgi:hypothetical protein
MIVIKQVKRDVGQVLLKVEYDKDGEVFSTWVDARDVVERLKMFRDLMGRRPTAEECKTIFVKMINELREKKEPFMDVIPWENYINIDLEGSS